MQRGLKGCRVGLSCLYSTVVLFLRHLWQKAALLTCPPPALPLPPNACSASLQALDSSKSYPKKNHQKNIQERSCLFGLDSGLFFMTDIPHAPFWLVLSWLPCREASLGPQQGCVGWLCGPLDTKVSISPSFILHDGDKCCLNVA